MEAAVGNFVRPGSKLRVFTAGHFADRIALMGQRQGARSCVAARNGAKFLHKRRLWRLLSWRSPMWWLLCKPRHPRELINRAGRLRDGAKSGGAGAGRLRHFIGGDAGGIGRLASTSPIVVPERFELSGGAFPRYHLTAAWSGWRIDPDDPVTWYLDLRLLAKYYEPPHAYHHTPSPPLFYALHQGLAVVEEEGLAKPLGPPPRRACAW